MITENSVQCSQALTGTPVWARAPGKLILSGEHAVVYGAPALVLSLPSYARARFCMQQPSNRPGVHIQLTDLDSEAFYSWEAARVLHQQCRLRHQQYQQNNLSVTEVLPDPASLYVCVLMYGLALLGPAVEALEDRRLQLCISSELPLGSGMGSSAATLAASLQALAEGFGISLERQQLHSWVQAVECLQHGRSSGLDPAAAVYGGLLSFQQTQNPQTRKPESHRSRTSQPQIKPHHGINLKGWYYFDSGRPEVSTGQCTAAVKQRFAASAIWNAFAETTEALLVALKAQASADIAAAVRRNHRLLCDIGVVPQPIQQLIARLEAQGASAKISGAGAVAGEGAGLVLVYSPAMPPQLPGMDFLPLQLDQAGACIETGINNSHE